MPSKPKSVPMTSAVVSLILIELLRNKGVSAKHIQNRTGIERSVMDHPDIYIPYVQLLALFRFAVEVTGDSALALRLRGEYGKGTMHFVHCIALNSENLLKAAQHQCRYSSLICEAERYEILEDRKTVKLVYTITVPALQNIWTTEHHLLLMVQYGRNFSGNRLKPLEVHFRHPAPAYWRAYEKAFLAPVFFDQPENAVILKRKDLLQPIAPRNPHLQAVLIKQAEASLDSSTREISFATKVREALIKHLPTGETGIETVAIELNTTRSTLYRRLKQEGVSYSSVLESVRKELSQTYLEQGMNITQITYLLGFAHPSAMQTAFKRWYNKSPGQFRKTMRDKSAASH